MNTKTFILICLINIIIFIIKNCRAWSVVTFIWFYIEMHQVCKTKRNVHVYFKDLILNHISTDPLPASYYNIVKNLKSKPQWNVILPKVDSFQTLHVGFAIIQ